MVYDIKTNFPLVRPIKGSPIAILPTELINNLQYITLSLYCNDHYSRYVQAVALKLGSQVCTTNVKLMHARVGVMAASQAA